jgi:hypothetical protein
MSSPFLGGGAFRITTGQGPYQTVLTGSSLSNPFQKTWFIDGTNGSDGSDGLSPQTAFKTFGQVALAFAAGDTIIVGPGTYTLAATFSPLANQTFIASVQKARGRSVILLSSGIADLIDINVNGVSFYGFEFRAGDATCDNLINVANTAACSGLHVVNCAFNGNSQTSVVGLNDASATFAGTAMYIANCHFVGLTGTGINIGVLGMGPSWIVNNLFSLDTTGQVGIALADTTSFTIGKGYLIEHNGFIGFSSAASAVGISVAGTADTVGVGLVRENFFSYCTAHAITASKITKSEVNNFYGDGTLGGALVI